jgi:hypothetical protein
MPVVHTEGTLPHAGLHDQSAIAEREWGKIGDLALAYRLTGDKKYLTQTTVYLGAWFPLYKSSGNPIDETNLDGIFLALDLTRTELPTSTRINVLTFMHDTSARYLDWLDANYAKDPYNWSSHRIKIAVLGAYETGDKTLIRRATEAFTRQARQNLLPDGSVNDFAKRDALHYVVYDLEPLDMAAAAARAHGQDLFHPKLGPASLERCTDWLLPYALGQKTHEEFVHSTVSFDARRAAAGLKGYAGPWDPASSVGLLTLSSWLDPKYQPTLTEVALKTGGNPTPWILLATAIEPLK